MLITNHDPMYCMSIKCFYVMCLIYSIHKTPHRHFKNGKVTVLDYAWLNRIQCMYIYTDIERGWDHFSFYTLHYSKATLAAFLHCLATTHLRDIYFLAEELMLMNKSLHFLLLWLCAWNGDMFVREPFWKGNKPLRSVLYREYSTAVGV